VGPVFPYLKMVEERETAGAGEFELGDFNLGRPSQEIPATRRLLLFTKASRNIYVGR
jgi:hypothetical protein